MDFEQYAKEDIEAAEKLFTGMQTKRDLPTGDFREKLIESYEDGVFDIQFVGEDKPRRGIPISYAVRDSYGHILYLVGTDDTNWNWSTIIRAKRVV